MSEVTNLRRHRNTRFTKPSRVLRTDPRRLDRAGDAGRLRDPDLEEGSRRAIAEALDEKIAPIRDQLAEAESLRKEAEALKAEYEAKAKSVDKDRKALLERARHEAAEIVAKAKTDAEALIARRGRMAEDKIAAEERAAIEACAPSPPMRRPRPPSA